jgi:hypothetical protein
VYRSTRSAAFLLGIAVLLCIVASGCSLDQWVGVTAGPYVPARNGTAAAPLSEIQTVFVDRDNSTVWFWLVDGALTTMSFTPRAPREWPDGCPTNLYSTRMEVLEIGQHSLALPSLTIERPVLARNCPRDPVVVVLRNDGKIGGGGTACYSADQCVRFVPASEELSLPRSMKGYELYSFRPAAGDEWLYTLITGTNRMKSYSEVATPESEVSDQGIVKITVRRADALKSVLSLLPNGESVIWRDARELDDAPAPLEAFPARGVVRDVARHARRHGIELQIAGR